MRKKVKQVMDTLMNLVGTSMYAFTIIYGTQMEKRFPPLIIAMGSEPIVIAISYLAVYYLSTIDVKIALAAFIAVVIVHIDSINLASKKLLCE
jgi:hypothetical protein